MTKQDLVKKVQESFALKSQKEAGDMLDKFVDLVVEAVKSGEEVTLGDLGKFSTVVRPARTCRNPQTGESMEVPEKKAVKYRVGGKLKKAMNE